MPPMPTLADLEGADPAGSGPSLGDGPMPSRCSWSVTAAGTRRQVGQRYNNVGLVEVLSIGNLHEGNRVS